ncbi:MAG TPA: CDGSH iron-sulfur domain-containing protein [Candidatus Limnocylindrales bacterium]|nr:CDGSH iron-sulfur domain-containing protein [Candidatus Limnocylindrales bacterium]
MTDPLEPTPVVIRPTDNGSYRVTGPVILEDAQGGRWDLPAGKSVWLCRCGASQNRPFCDSSHKTVGFESVVRAPATIDATEAEVVKA